MPHPLFGSGFEVKSSILGCKIDRKCQSEAILQDIVDDLGVSSVSAVGFWCVPLYCLIAVFARCGHCGLRQSTKN